MKYKYIYIYLCMLGITSSSFAADPANLDAATEAAKKQTDTLLIDPNGPAMAQTKQISNDPAQQQKINALAADVFNKLVDQSGGDPDKMMQIVESAKRDPASFANSFTPEQQKQLEEIAKSMPASANTK